MIALIYFAFTLKQANTKDKITCLLFNLTLKFNLLHTDKIKFKINVKYRYVNEFYLNLGNN